MAAAEEDFTGLPLTERLAHKVWKARLGAYEEVTKLFKTLDPDAVGEYQKYTEFLKKMAVDSNLVAQEAGLAAILSFVEFGPTTLVVRTRKEIVSALVDKCLGSSRAGTRTKAVDLILMLIEADVADPVIDEVLPGLDNKTPKVVVGCVTALKEAVRQFGSPAVVNPKPIIKVLSKLFDHKDTNVRNEAKTLTIELRRWLGPAIQSSLSDLKPVQLKELNDAFDQLPNERARPERYLRSQQAKMAARAASTEDVEMGSVENVVENDDAGVDGDAGVENEPVAIDTYDLADPVNVLDKLPKDFYDSLASAKWKDRKEALENLLGTLKNSPKLEDGRYFELVGALAKRVQDVNVLVAVASTQCIDYLAKGLRKAFSPYKSAVISPMIERLKEKKQNVMEVLRSALDSVFNSLTNVSEVLDDITTGAAHKNPNVKAESVLWLVRILKNIKVAPKKEEIKAVSEMLLKCMEDGTIDVREAAFEGLGTLMKVVTERQMSAYIDKLDKFKEAKVREYFEKAETRCSGPGAKKAPAKALAPVATSRAGKPPKMEVPMTVDIKDKENSPPGSEVGVPPMRKPAVKSARPDSAATKKKTVPTLSAPPAPKKAKAVIDDNFTYQFTDASAEEKLTDYMTEEQWAQLSDSSWKVRLEAINSLAENIQNKDVATIETEVVVRLLCARPGWKENNFQVMTRSVNILQHLADNVPSFGKPSVALAVPGLVDKLGDMKVKKVASDCMCSFAQSTSLQFVLSQAYAPLKILKSPKAIQDALAFIQYSLMDFGVVGVQIRELIDYIKTALGNTNQGVRNAAVSALGVVRMFTGPEIKVFVQDLNPALITIIETEFDKVADRSAPKPTREQKFFSQGPKASAGGSTSADGEASGSAAAPAAYVEDVMDDLIPRVDISAQITGKLLEEMGDAGWKIRKEALDNLAGILESANYRIKPTIGDLMPALKARLSDSNKNLVAQTVDICGNLAKSMGRPFDKYVKYILSHVIACLADNKTHVRATTINALENIFTATSMEPLITVFATSLMAPQPFLRKELLKWLGDKFAEGIQGGDLTVLVPTMFSCLQDRDADVRKVAQTFFGFVVENVGYDYVREKCSDVPGGKTAVQTVVSIVENFKSVGSKVTTPASTSSPALSAKDGPKKSASSAPSSSRPSTASSAKPSAKGKGLQMKPPLSAGGSKRDISESSPALSKEVPLLTSDPRAKEIRADKNKGPFKWSFDTPRKELVDFLGEQMAGNFGNEIHSQLFSTDHYKEKDHLAAISLLDDLLVSQSMSTEQFDVPVSEMKHRFVANSDLILRYITLRFFDTNTSMMLKCLDLVQHVIELLDEYGYHLSEYEASSFLPVFVNKVGDSKDAIRSRIRAIMKQVCRIYPASKFFGYVLDGLNSKNARTRTECLEELAVLIQRNGLTVCNPAKALPVVAQQIGDRDANVRNAAINSVVQAYLLVGDAVYKYLGRISEKDRSLLEERLKRLPSGAAAGAGAGKTKAEDDAKMASPERRKNSQALSDEPVSARTMDRRSPVGTPRSSGPADIGTPGGKSVRREFSLDLEKLELPKLSSVPARDTASPRPTPREAFSASSQKDYMLDFVITQITSGDANQSVDALKQMEKILTGPLDVVIPHIDQLINAVTLQTRLAFTAPDVGSQALQRVCKHLVNVLIQVFSKEDLAKVLSRDSLYQLMQELLHRLLDPNLSALEHGPQLARALNVLMVRILETTDRNASFSVLLAILEQSASSMKTLSPQLLSTQSKYTELVMKCLWKLTKLIQEMVKTNNIKINQLLLDVHTFLVASPPTDWKQRMLDKVPLADMPLRTVKTILHELVTSLGAQVLNHLNMITDPQRSYAYSYLQHMLESAKKKGAMPSAGDDNKSRTSSPTQMSASRPMTPSAATTAYANATPARAEVKRVMTPTKPVEVSAVPAAVPAAGSEKSTVAADGRLSSEEIDTQLGRIFERIGSKDETKLGIEELYRFQKQHPYAEEQVDLHLSRTGAYFQSYIRRNLSKLAAEDQQSTDGNNQQVRDTPTSPLESSTENYKQKLLRLQQMFGYKDEGNTSPEERPASASVPITSPIKAAGSLVTAMTFDSPIRPSPIALGSVDESSSTYQSIETIHLPPSTSNVAASVATKPAGRNDTIAELKERLARMKVAMSTAPKSPVRD